MTLEQRKTLEDHANACALQGQHEEAAAIRAALAWGNGQVAMNDRVCDRYAAVVAERDAEIARLRTLNESLQSRWDDRGRTLGQASERRERLWFVVKCLNRLRRGMRVADALDAAGKAVDMTLTDERRQAAFECLVGMVGD